MSIAPHIASRARKMAHDFGMMIWDAPIEETGIFEGDLGYVEHCAHELGHAMLLRLRFAPGVSQKVSRALDRRKWETQVWHEAGAWAIEWYALQELGVPIEWGDVTAGAEIQQVPMHVLYEVVKTEWAQIKGYDLADYLRYEPTTDARIAARAKELSHHYRMHGSGNQLAFTGPDVEHCVHELSHAASLGIDPTAGISLSDVIEERIEALPQAERDNEEASALAIEWFALRALYVNIRRSDLDQMASAQNVAELLPKWLNSLCARHKSRDVVAWIRK